jgi:hypothetical protein
MLSFRNFTHTLIGAAAIIQLNVSPVYALDGTGCSASEGYTYCESTATCIQACPVQNGQGFSGSVTMECTNGQCDGMSGDCSLFDISNAEALNGLLWSILQQLLH